MLDRRIQDFFQKRKEDWINKKTNPSMHEDKIREVEREGEIKFSPQNWLPDAAKRAGQMEMSTHPCTFSHPSARKNKNGYVTSVIVKIDRQPDGYLKTGNVDVAEDALGNAAVLDVYKFLTLTMEDGDSLLEHIKRDSEQAKALLTIPSEGYQSLKEGLLAMVNNQTPETVTSSKIKQVYFPVKNDDYHLLSILSNSGMIYELRDRIDALRFSEKQKELRDLRRNDQFSEKGFSEIYDITTISYGGTKPQNISVMNNQYGGRARLLMSVPPRLVKRDIQFPTKDFFKTSIRFYDIQEPLQKLHGVFKTELNSPIPRRNLKSGRDAYIKDILDQIIERLTAVRAVAADQYREENSSLPRCQRIWLCDTYQQERLEQEDWLDELCEVISRWTLLAYKKVVKKSVSLGPAESRYIQEMVEADREALR